MLGPLPETTVWGSVVVGSSSLALPLLPGAGAPLSLVVLWLLFLAWRVYD